MLGLMVTLLAVALITGVLGLGGLAGAAIAFCKIVFSIAILLFLLTALISLARGRTAVRRRHPVDAPH